MTRSLITYTYLHWKSYIGDNFFLEWHYNEPISNICIQAGNLCTCFQTIQTWTIRKIPKGEKQKWSGFGKNCWVIFLADVFPLNEVAWGNFLVGIDWISWHVYYFKLFTRTPHRRRWMIFISKHSGRWELFKIWESWKNIARNFMLYLSTNKNYPHNAWTF